MIQPRQKRKMLGEMLISEGLLTKERLDEAISEQRKTGGRLGTVLKSLGYVTEQDIIRVLGAQMGIQHQVLSSITIDQEAVKLVPETLARRHQAVPLFVKDDVMTVAMVDPLNVFAMDDLKELTGLDIQPVVSAETDVLKAIDRYYSVTSGVEEALKDMDDDQAMLDRRAGRDRRKAQDRRGSEPSDMGPYLIDQQGKSVVSQLAPDSLELAGGIAGADQGPLAAQGGSPDAPIIKLVNLVIAQAVREGASDIHVEPDSEVLRIRNRVDGLLHEVMSPPRNAHAGFVSRIKIMANLDISEKRIPQDGRIRMKVGQKSLDLRISTLPTIFGEKLEMRLLDKQGVLFGLEELGFTSENMGKYQQLIRRPYGLILVTGPTGSGKTTTLYASLNTINSPEKNIVTIEDPVEYQLKGINQVQVNAKVGITFATGLRSILRQDPDIVLIGEIRDRETATIAVQAALTGHLVLSTLHTNDASGAVARLTDIGVEPFLISSSLNAVVAQRLVRKICGSCSQPYSPDPQLLQDLGIQGKNVTFKRGHGCQECRDSGYSGRIALMELMIMNEALRQIVVTRGSTASICSKAQETGFRRLRQDGLMKVMQGQTTIEEVLRVTQDIED